MDIINTLLEISIYSGVIFIVTMLLKKVFRRSMSPRLHFAVWLVLIARLMLPVTIDSGFHVFTVPAQTQNEIVSTPQTASFTAASSAEFAAENEPPTISAAEPVTTAVSPASAIPVRSSPLSVENVLLIVWLSGAGLSLAYILALYIALRRRVRRNAAMPSERLSALFKEIMAEMNIKTRLRLICQYEYGTPALLLPRTVLMPVNALVSMDDEQLRFALRHELTHYKHGDHFTCLLMCVLNAVYWFNPFVWLALGQMRADMEVACDGEVVKTMDVPQKSRYASLIVGLFAQPQRRQLVIGMALAKKAAVQRIHGIFMESKSRRSAKLASALIAVLLAITCFTTACQPTPEEPVIVNKGDNHLEEMIASSSASAAPSPSASPEVTQSEEERDALRQALRESIGAPETVSDAFANTKGDVTVSIDATVDVPAVTALPAAAVTMSQLSQEQTDEFAAYFLKGADVFTEEDVRIKDEIMVDIISKRRTLERLSQETEGNVEQSIIDAKEQIAELEKEYNAAPEQKNQTSSTTDLLANEDGSSLYVRAELGKDAPAQFRVSNSSYGIYFSFNDDGYGFYHPIGLPAEEIDGVPRGMTTPQDAAENIVVQCLSDLGIEDMQIADVKATNYYRDKNDYNDEEYVKKANQCYVFTLAKSLNGIPVSLIDSSVPLDSDDPNVTAHQEPEYTNIPDPEYICVYVDDTGIVRFEWYYPSAVTSMLSEQVTLLPFDDIAARAKENIFYKNYTAYDSTADIYITNIQLNLMRIMRKDKPGEYMLVPVWDFIGNVKQSFEGEEPKLSSFTNRSYVTINAIDGSWINRDWGY